MIHLALALAFPAAFSFQAEPEAARRRALEELEARLQDDVLADDVGSIAGGVIVGTEVIWSGAIGFADREEEREADPDTLYRIGSISKSVTAVALMALVQRGVVALDDPAVKHLPELARLGGGVPQASTITLRQLASHTAGLAREPELEGAASGPIAGWEEKVLESIAATKVIGAPGERFAYSNIGYGILGLALSRAAKEPFPELVQRLVFEPAGMRSSTFVCGPDLAARLATGYQNDPGGPIDAATPALEHAGRGYKVPNGGVYSTVGDLCRFMALVSGAFGDSALTAASRAELLARQTPADGDAYGLGFFLTTDARGRRYALHDGGVAGYTAQIVLDVDARTGVALLRNYVAGRTSMQGAAERLLAEVAGENSRGPAR